MVNHISYTDARNLTDQVVDHFRMPNPQLVWNHPFEYRAYADLNRMIIVMPIERREAFVSNHIALVHELAHVLAYTRGYEGGHGTPFWKALRDIIDFLHITDYPWWWEYEEQPWLHSVNNALLKFSERILPSWRGLARLTMTVAVWLRSYSAKVAGRPRSIAPENVYSIGGALRLNVPLM